ncbi:hypothetical protein QZM68_33860, partial [Burkholderia gladioli]|uniref:hypothetical protein n=1 Tax=Burkholderia gladioli TaxID=28095 RepID=UPI00265098DF
AELLQQLGGNRRQLGRHGFRFARHMFSLGQKYASNTKLRTGPAKIRQEGYARRAAAVTGKQSMDGRAQ